MNTEKVKPDLSVTLDVKAVNYQNGNVMETKGKITKMISAGEATVEEDSLTIRGTDCGKSQMEANYNSSSQGANEETTNVELDIKGRVLTDKGTIVDVVSASAKLAKSEVGHGEDGATEDWLKLKLENGCDAKCATSETFYTHKISETA